MPKKQTTVAPNPGGAHSIRARGLVQLAFPLTDEERRRIHAAASLAGQSAAEWLRIVAVEAAEGALAK